ncbi:MAG TPA: hypothetical protein VGC41_11510 [Kofleriaceae bacterium]
MLVIGTATFDLVSAVVITCGRSPWLAVAAGVLACPIFPITIRIVAKRPSVPICVLISAIIATVIVSRTILPALRDHALWFLPDRVVWFPSDPPPARSRAMCETFATMEFKCEKDIAIGYDDLVRACSTAAKFSNDVQWVTTNVEIAERCAISTSSCDDYRACQETVKR